MKVKTERHQDQLRRWPTKGRVILAQADDATIVVYQAYRPEIANYAVEHQRFGGAFSYQRMSWIKPNFLWMMYRSGWGTKPGQEVVLAIHLDRSFFDELLEVAVHSSFDDNVYSSAEKWKARVAESDVRLQWDPDHDPSGARLSRRAIQLGIRGPMLKRYGTVAVKKITDVSKLARNGRNAISAKLPLELPRETIYHPRNLDRCRHLGLEFPLQADRA